MVKYCKRQRVFLDSKQERSAARKLNEEKMKRRRRVQESQETEEMPVSMRPEEMAASMKPEEMAASMRPDAEATQEEKRKERPPLLAVTLVRKATNTDSFSIEEWCKRIYLGVFMNPEKLKFWVDRHLEKNCFLLLAEELSITGMEDQRYWGWSDQKEKCYSGEVDIRAAKLSEVCSLSISGKFKTITLSPKTKYEVAFVVKISKKNSRGWHAPVNLNLSLPDGTMRGRIENLEEKQKGKWIDILVGTFMTTPKNVGEISFSLSETGGHAKSGLLVKGVILRPKD